MCRSFAAVEALIESLQDQISALQEENAALQVQSAERRVQSKDANQNHSALCSLNSALPRAKLTAPANLGATAFGSSFLRVSWNPVIGAKGYLVQYSSDSSFVNDVHALMVDAPGSSVTLSGLKADTMYHVKVKTVADSGDTDSDFSTAYLIRTGIASNEETAAHLEGWLANLQTQSQNASTLVPEIGNTVLTMGERRRLLGSGVRRYGFIDKVSDTAVAWPQFWPDYVDDAEKERLKILLREIEALRNLMVFFESGASEVQDLLLIRGNEAFRIAGKYYGTIRDAARRQVPDAEALFQLLQGFWRRRRGTSAEPTKKQTMRNVKGLMNGTREGEMYFENESDTVTKGKKKIVDKTRRKSRNGFKEIDTGSAEFSDQVGEFGEYDDELSAVE